MNAIVEQVTVNGMPGTLVTPVQPTQPVRLQRLDRVRISNGSVLIVTGYNPSRPKNCYTGVLENGQGKEYVFGAKHYPCKIGTVDEGHSALLNNAARGGTRSTHAGGTAAGPGLDRGTAVLARQLAELVQEGNGNSDAAKVLSGALVVALAG